jgi:hypothetical protein
MSEQLEADERALPEDDLEHYTGQWVAMRDGTVVAHDADPGALQANPQCSRPMTCSPSATRRRASTP